MKPSIIPELLAPAGSLSCLKTALAYGADAVYAGAQTFSMRPDTASFTVEQLRDASRYVRKRNKRLYVAVNSMMFDPDVNAFSNWLDQTADIPLDAVILSDPGAMFLLRKKRPEVGVHISTQAGTANSASARFWKDMGAQRVILARECSLTQTEEIVDQSGLDVEIFVHGAMCVAVSGRCLLSAHLSGKSGSRGECKQSCRWDWQLIERQRPGEAIPVFESNRKTIFLGSKDLCLLEHIPEVIQSGAASLKIEGRMKNEYYVGAVTRLYRDALDRYAACPQKYIPRPQWRDELEAVSHREYATGFAFGYPEKSPEDIQTRGDYISTHYTLGFVEHVSGTDHTVCVKNPIRTGDEIEWIGPRMTGGKQTISEIRTLRGNTEYKAVCGRKYIITFREESVLPQWALLRSRFSSA